MMLRFNSTRPKHLYLFHHVGKCAGTSLVEAFGQTGRAGICLGFQCHEKREVRRSARRQILQQHMSPRRLRVFYGHRVYYGLHHLCPQPPRYFTFLRHPVSRVVSLYNYHCDIAFNPRHQHHVRDRDRLLRDGHPIPFEEWFERQYTGNHLIRFLSYAMAGELIHVPEPMNAQHLQHAIEFLEKCWFIGFTETSDRDIPKVCQAVGVRAPRRRSNVSRQHLDASQLAKARQIIETRDELDMLLYETACRLRGLPSATRMAMSDEMG